MTHPLILTGTFAEPDQARFDRLRRQHFPPHLNHIAAHLTLFHHLPGDELDELDGALATESMRPAPAATVSGLRSLGRGTALVLSCPELGTVRAALARRFQHALTAQDRQGWRPHVTIQNKVSPAEAASLLAAMQAGFTPFAVRVSGLSLWHYLGGPWSLARHYPFAAPD